MIKMINLPFYSKCVLRDVTFFLFSLRNPFSKPWVYIREEFLAKNYLIHIIGGLLGILFINFLIYSTICINSWSFLWKTRIKQSLPTRKKRSKKTVIRRILLRKDWLKYGLVEMMDFRKIDKTDSEKN